MSKIRCYKCFSVPQKDWLLSKGLEYIAVAIDPKTKNTFWMFIKSKELDDYLTEWTNNKPSEIL